jgi:tetratricopeptide (TPR) repeat protein
VEDFLSADPYLLEEAAPTEVGVSDSLGQPSALPSADEEDADSHYRKAMFFYDAGKLARALDEIDLTLMANPTHSSARKWLLRITDELNELIDTHYQNGLLNRKFMRYREAENDFQLVMELSRDKLDDRYLDARKQLEELEELE